MIQVGEAQVRNVSLYPDLLELSTHFELPLEGLHVAPIDVAVPNLNCFHRFGQLFTFVPGVVML